MGALATQWNVRWNISKIQYLTPFKLGTAIIGSPLEVYSEPCQIAAMECAAKNFSH